MKRDREICKDIDEEGCRDMKRDGEICRDRER